MEFYCLKQAAIYTLSLHGKNYESNTLLTIFCLDPAWFCLTSVPCIQLCRKNKHETIINSFSNIHFGLIGNKNFSGKLEFFIFRKPRDGGFYHLYRIGTL